MIIVEDNGEVLVHGTLESSHRVRSRASPGRALKGARSPARIQFQHPPQEERRTENGEPRKETRLGFNTNFRLRGSLPCSWREHHNGSWSVHRTDWSC